MFWGLIMEPNKRYTQVVEKSFRVSQVALDTSTGENDACQVMVIVQGKNFLICTLQKNKCIQHKIDLCFKTGDNISFLTNGSCNIHLSGYLDLEYDDDAEEEEEEEEDNEAPVLIPVPSKRKLNGLPELAKKKLKKQQESDDDDDDDDSGDADQLRKFLDGEDVDSDDEDESFKDTSEVAESDDEEDSDKEAEAEEDDDEQDVSKAEMEVDTSQESTTEQKLSKSQKRRLKKKLAQEKKNAPQLNGVEKPKKPEPKKKGEDAAEVSKEKKSVAGGVSIEDIKVGTGAPAKNGKVVQVYYEGRLKTNNKMFDSCQKGPGFKFRLGSKEVIKGWDHGVLGMKVGGKRKIICPPPMAYGAKGSPPVIPPNATLVFEVELKNVK